jgi:hypothetical protein
MFSSDDDESGESGLHLSPTARSLLPAHPG